MVLSQFEQGPSWILVVGGGKANLQGMEETLPGRKLAVTGHPLVPGQSSAVHVKGRDGESVVIRGVVIFKKLSDFEYPTQWVRSIEPGHIELDARVR